MLSKKNRYSDTCNNYAIKMSDYSYVVTTMECGPPHSPAPVKDWVFQFFLCSQLMISMSWIIAYRPSEEQSCQNIYTIRKIHIPKPASESQLQFQYKIFNKKFHLMFGYINLTSYELSWTPHPLPSHWPHTFPQSVWPTRIWVSV